MPSTDDQGRFERELARLLAEAAPATMPFGKYGPQHYPPNGLPIIDLPYEYLAWLARTGFPRGRLGVLLRFVHRAKQDGADGLFDAIRAARGGRVSLRRERRRQWSFPDDAAPPASS